MNTSEILNKINTHQLKTGSPITTGELGLGNRTYHTLGALEFLGLIIRFQENVVISYEGLQALKVS